MRTLLLRMTNDEIAHFIERPERIFLRLKGEVGTFFLHLISRVVDQIVRDPYGKAEADLTRVFHA
jgi:hypothetical protein